MYVVVGTQTHKHLCMPYPSSLVHYEEGSHGYPLCGTRSGVQSEDGRGKPLCTNCKAVARRLVKQID